MFSSNGCTRIIIFRLLYQCSTLIWLCMVKMSMLFYCYCSQSSIVKQLTTRTMHELQTSLQQKHMNNTYQPKNDDASLSRQGVSNLKGNMDTSFSTTLNCIQFGMCTRYDEGRFLLAKIHWSHPICSIEIGEAGCLRCGLIQFCA